MSESWTNTLQKLGARFDAGQIVGYSSLPMADDHEARNGVCDLSHYGVLKISGDDASNFLHGQFTNDVLALEAGQAQSNGWCSPKGRLLAVFTLWRSAQAYYLLLPRALLAATQKRLRMFVLRSMVIVEDESDLTIRFGLVRCEPTEAADAIGGLTALPKGVVSVHPSGTAVRISSTRTLMLSNAAAADTLWRELTANSTPLVANAWDLATIREGIIEIYPETQDTYVPQMANFELVDGVNFKKGCYPGQEIVARTQYRGILKRRMARVQIVREALVPAGTPVYSPNFPDQAVGSIAMSAKAEHGRIEALVIAQRESIDANSLYLSPQLVAADHLMVAALPYSIPR